MNLPIAHLIVLLSLFFIFVHANKAADYENKGIDSLIRVLENIPEKDTTYIETLITLARKIRTEDFDQSEIYFKQAIELSRKLSASQELIISLSGIGINYGMQDKYAEAIRYFREALQVALDNKNALGAASSYNNLGIVYKRMGEYPTSLAYYAKSMAIDDSLGNQEGVATACHNIGVLFDLMKEPDKAMEYYSKAFSGYQKQNNRGSLRLANLQVDVANIHQQKNEYGEALQLLNTALEYFENNNHIPGAITARFSIGYIYYKMGEYANAESYLQPTFKEAEKHKFQQEKSAILNNLAKIKALQGNHAQSIELAMRVKDLADSVSSLKFKADAQELLSFVYQKAGNLKKALEHLENFNALQDSIFSETKTRNYKNQQVMLEVHEKDKQLETQTIRLAFLDQQVVLENRWKWTLGFASLFLFIAGTLYYQKYRQKRQYSDELESKNKVITQQKKEIEEINLQLEKRMLRAQMNPHFIFNALSSIQHFITTNDRVSALHYLSHFSNMLRQILETSVNINMALKDEIELIKIYLELEALRFERNFTYEINIDDNLDAEIHEVPTMIIQPFVENAILHGLMIKKGDRRLSIDIRESGSFICCIITDNGIGREAAEQINRNKTGKAVSRGISVTRERLDLLARNYGLQTEIRYTDLKDETGKAAGTQVEIKIPKQEL